MKGGERTITIVDRLVATAPDSARERNPVVSVRYAIKTAERRFPGETDIPDTRTCKSGNFACKLHHPIVLSR